LEAEKEGEDVSHGECKIPGANPVMPSRKAEKQGTHSVEHRLELVNGKLSRIVQRKHPLQLAPGI
jgi:hypothetical protein